MDFAEVFRNYKITKSITSYQNNGFSRVTSFVTVCDPTGNYNFVVDFEINFWGGYGRIVKFDDNWNYVNFINMYYPVSMLAFNKNESVNFIVTSRYGIYSYDKNMNLLNSYSNYSVHYTKMYYNSSKDQLYVLSYSYSRIDVFNHALAFIKSIPISNKPLDIDANNDSIYVVTESSALIYIIQNDSLTRTFSTTHTWIWSILVDKSGDFAIIDYYDNIYIYESNGSYSGVSWNIQPNIKEMSFDSNGDLVLLAANGLFIMSNFSLKINSSGIMIDTVCILNSKKLKYLFINKELIYSILFLDQTQSFVTLLPAYNNIKNITTYNGNSIVTGYYIGFCYICSASSTGFTYFVAFFNGIVAYDNNFNFKIYKSGFSYPRTLISVNNNNNVELFIAGSYGVFKSDINLNITASYLQGGPFTGLYYNHTGDYILVCSYLFIQVLNRVDLNFIKDITTAPYVPTYINEFNGTLYVSTTTGALLRVVNEVSFFYFNTACSSSISSAIDSFGVIAVLCNQIVHLYSIN